MATATTQLSGSFTADPVHSSFNFSVRYQGVSLYRGSLTDVSASLNDGVLEGSARVESISITTPEQFRAHVLSAEFFDVENHPEVTFRSTKVDLADDGTASVQGDLTIKGITKPFEAKGTWTAPATDAFGNTRAHLQLEGVLDRTEYDIKWNMALPSGGNVLANDVTLSVDLSLIAAQA
jgi:polyisoprenoid-binding protein YceI